MKKTRKIGLILIIFSGILAALCGVGLYATQENAAVPELSASPLPTAEPTPPATEAPNRTPEIALIGENPLTVTANPAGYTDPGWIASDDRDGDLTEQVAFSADVNTYHAGEGTAVYTVTDSEGLTASVERKIIVAAAERGETRTPEGKTIYLTFDDGPSANTERLLDVLDAYGAKATFFVTACHPDYVNQIGEMARRGHSVGIHSATHDYQSIYQSEEAYFSDLVRMQEIIYEQTGEYSRLVRFPGGGSNTVSSYNPGIMTQLVTDLNDMGYAYFDWNVTAADTASNASRSTVIANIKDGVSQHDASIVLQHDTNSFSVDAVEEILIWGLQNGYTFRALDVSSPTAHHPVAN